MANTARVQKPTIINVGRGIKELQKKPILLIVFKYLLLFA